MQKEDKKGLSLMRLFAFQDVAEAGGIAQAVGSDERNQQNQLRAQIRELEDYFGKKFFERNGHKLLLTCEGKRLLHLVREFRAGLQQLEASWEHPSPIRLGAGDRLMQWFLIPRLKHLYLDLPRYQIELFNLSTKAVIERLDNFTLDWALLRSSEVVKRAHKALSIQSDFSYSVFVLESVSKDFADNKQVLQSVPMAIAQKYQDEVEEAAQAAEIPLMIRLLCSTFPQARRAVTSGYAAILPSAAFSPSELIGVRKLELPFVLPRLTAEESSFSLVWNPRLEKLRPDFAKILPILKKVFVRAVQNDRAGKPTQQSSPQIAPSMSTTVTTVARE